MEIRSARKRLFLHGTRLGLYTVLANVTHATAAPPCCTSAGVPSHFPLKAQCSSSCEEVSLHSGLDPGEEFPEILHGSMVRLLPFVTQD